MRNTAVQSGIPLVTNPENFQQLSVVDNTRSAIDEFGSVPSYKVINPWDRTSSTHYDAPTAYGLSYVQLNTLITGQIEVDAADYWYTGVALPIRKISGQRISWNVISFDNTYAERLPYESAPRIISSEMASDSDSIERRGIGFKMEHGFMKEEMGREMYFYNIKHMATIVSETINFGVLSAYFSCKNYNAEYEKKHGYFGRDLVENLFKREINQWCVLQKHQNGFFIMDTVVSRMHGRYGVKDLDMYIMPEEVNTFLVTTPEENVTYEKGGPLAVQNRIDQTGITLDNKRSALIYGNKYTIFFTRTFYVDENEMGINPMFRSRQIGEYFAMVPVVPGPEPGVGYKTNNRSIRVYDEKQDNFVTLTLSMALQGVSDIQFYSNTGKPKSEDDIATGGNGEYDHGSDGSDLAQYVLLKPTDPGANPDRMQSGSFLPLERFGELRREHFSTRSWVEMAKSFIAKASGDLGFDGLMNDFEEGLALVRAARNHSVEKYVLARPTTSSSRTQKTPKLDIVDKDPDAPYPFGRFVPSLGGVDVLVTESNFGANPLDVFASDDATVYMTNWPGLQYLANKRTEVDYSDELNDSVIKKIQKFVKAVGIVAAQADAILTTHDKSTSKPVPLEFLDPRFTPSYFPFESKEAVMLSYFDEFDEAFPVWYAPFQVEKGDLGVGGAISSAYEFEKENKFQIGKRINVKSGIKVFNDLLQEYYDKKIEAITSFQITLAMLISRSEKSEKSYNISYPLQNNTNVQDVILDYFKRIQIMLGIYDRPPKDNFYPQFVWEHQKNKRYLKTNEISLELANRIVVLFIHLREREKNIDSWRVLMDATNNERTSWNACKKLVVIVTEIYNTKNALSQDSTGAMPEELNNLRDFISTIEKNEIPEKNFLDKKFGSLNELSSGGKFTETYPYVTRAGDWSIKAKSFLVRSTLTIGKNQLRSLFSSWENGRGTYDDEMFFSENLPNVTVSLPGNYDVAATYDEVEAYLNSPTGKKTSGSSSLPTIDWSTINLKYKNLLKKNSQKKKSKKVSSKESDEPLLDEEEEDDAEEKIEKVDEKKAPADEESIILDYDTFHSIFFTLSRNGKPDLSATLVSVIVWDLLYQLNSLYKGASGIEYAFTPVSENNIEAILRTIIDRIPSGVRINKKISLGQKKRIREDSSPSRDGGEYGDDDENEEGILEKTIKKAKFGEGNKSSTKRIGMLYPKDVFGTDRMDVEDDHQDSWVSRRRTELDSVDALKKARDDMKLKTGPSLQKNKGYFTRDLVEVECGNYENNPNFEKLLNEVRVLPHPKLVGMVINLLSHAHIHVDVLDHFLANDIIFPFGAIFLRPHQRYVTGSIIKTKAGTDTGATYWNYRQNDFQEENHVLDKTRIGSFTWESKSIVTNPMKVMIITDAICTARKGGSGTQIFNAVDAMDGYYQPSSNSYGEKDMFVALIPYEEREIPEVLDICGSFEYASYPGFNDIRKKSLHYSSAAVLNKFWKWRRFTAAKDYFIEYTQHSGHYGRKWLTEEPCNHVCWRGFTSHFDHTLNKRVIMPGTGHFGNYVGQGFREKRDGALCVWKPFDFSNQVI